MSRWWAVLMLLSGGLFVGGVISIAWERIPAWRRTDPSEFRAAFTHTLRRVDRLQPVLLIICLASTIGFAAATDGAARVLALLAAAGFLIVLIGSVVWLVPIQRRLTARGRWVTQDFDRLRTHWMRGHIARSILGLAALIMAALSATT